MFDWIFVVNIMAIKYSNKTLTPSVSNDPGKLSSNRICNKSLHWKYLPRILHCIPRVIKLMKEGQGGCWCMFCQILQFCQWQFAALSVEVVTSVSWECNLIAILLKKGKKYTTQYALQQIVAMQCICTSNACMYYIPLLVLWIERLLPSMVFTAYYFIF